MITFTNCGDPWCLALQEQGEGSTSGPQAWGWFDNVASCYIYIPVQDEGKMGRGWPKENSVNVLSTPASPNSSQYPREDHRVAAEGEPRTSGETEASMKEKHIPVL